MVTSPLTRIGRSTIPPKVVSAAWVRDVVALKVSVGEVALPSLATVRPVGRVRPETSTDAETVFEPWRAVMTVVKEASTPRFASLAGWMDAAKAPVTVLDEKAVEANPLWIGLAGSPTKVVTIFPPPTKGGGEKVDARGDAAAGARAISDFLEKKGLVKHG